MNGPVLARSDVNILQAVNITIGTSAFIALADAVPKMTDFAGSVSPGRVAYVVLIVFWSIKLLVENHKSFASANVQSHPRYSVFQLAMLVGMGVTLIVAAKNAEELLESSFWLMLSLIFGLGWLVGLAIFFIITVGFDKRKYRWWWVASGVATVLGSGIIFFYRLDFDSSATLAIIMVMLGLGVADAYKTETFFL